MNPFPAILNALNTAQLSEPVRLYLYSVGGVVVAGFTLFGVIADQTSTFLLTALGIVLAVVAPAAELARLGVYSPRALADAGWIDLPGRHTPEHARAGRPARPPLNDLRRQP